MTDATVVSAPATVQAGPCQPSTGSHSPLPLRSVTIQGGLWGDWQEANSTISLVAAIARLDDAGSLRNLRIAAGDIDGAFTHPVFMDSDVYKVLEAIAWDLGRRPDAAFESFLVETTELLARVQQESGYLNSWGQLEADDRHFVELTFSHELYCAGHLIQAAVAAKRSLGFEPLLVVARRLADHLVDVFLRGGHPGNDGHPEVETALVELYRLTGHQDYLDLATHFIDGRGYGTIGHEQGLSYIQDHEPFRQVDSLVGHAVRALYLEAGAVDVAVENHDAGLLDASIRHWEDTVATKTSLTGGHGSRYALEAFGDRYELPADRSYNETCAAIASIHWNWRLLLATGEARYAELIERTLYNAFAVSKSSDSLSFFYANLMQRRSDHLDGASRGRRSEWFTCACCPPNVMRQIASLGEYMATVSGSTVFVHQYFDAELALPVDGDNIALRLRTDYPWNGDVAIEVASAPQGEFGIALRIPSWSARSSVSINGALLDQVPRRGAYLEVRREWRAGDTISVTLDLTPRASFPHPRIDALRNTMAIERGPLVYCVEQVDQGYGVDVEAVRVLLGGVPEELPVADLPGVGRTVLLTLPAQTHVVPDPIGLPYLTASPIADSADASLVAIPYFQWDNRDGRAMRVWIPTANS